MIIKSQNIEDIPKYDKEYWHAKTPQERLDAAMNRCAEAIDIIYESHL